jgi:hypothetical protein
MMKATSFSFGKKVAVMLLASVLLSPQQKPAVLKWF